MSAAKVTEIIASSSKSFDDAIEAGIERAGKTIESIRGAWVEGQKVMVEKGKITEYRVVLEVTFVLDDWSAPRTRLPVLFARATRATEPVGVCEAGAATTRRPRRSLPWRDTRRCSGAAAGPPGRPSASWYPRGN